MKARIVHRNTHVLDLDKTIDFYKKALGMHEVRRKGPEDGSWVIAFLAGPDSDFELELTWNRGRTKPYNNGGEDTHIAFRVDDYEAFHRLHKQMDCIVYENPAMGLYFIADPDGCWIEILPE
ncbi:MAG: lactoylglutathione lyase [Atopobium sp.]|jgi:lactoylglutathione lyase|nr:VOC family protein [Atopobiaceae bacterium]NLH91408.1 lactoylglutathione lyase [Atopobium sp.]